VEGSYNEAIKDWRGFLLLAIDSSYIAPPPGAAPREHCGAAGRELSAATARAPILCDIGSGVIADAGVERLAVGGRSLAKTEVLGGKDFIKCLRDKETKYVMRARKRFNSGIDRIRGGGGETRISEGGMTRAAALRLASGEREALITNLEEDEMEEDAFPELYYKCRPVEAKHN
jgi:hypothetical protein